MESFHFNSPADIVSVMVGAGLSASKSEAKRLIQQGGVKINGETVGSINLELSANQDNEEKIIQVGKRKFARVKIK